MILVGNTLIGNLATDGVKRIRTESQPFDTVIALSGVVFNQVDGGLTDLSVVLNDAQKALLGCGPRFVAPCGRRDSDAFVADPALLPRLKQQYADVTEAVEELIAQSHSDLWHALGEMEFLLEERDLLSRVKEKYQRRHQARTEIVDYTAEHREAFRQLNYGWIERYFEVEDSDRESLDDPDHHILEPGGAILTQALDESRRIHRDFLEKTGGSERIAVLREEMQAAMEEGAGIYREKGGLESASEKIRSLRERFRNVALDDRSQTFNTELIACLELSNLLDLAGVLLHSGLERKESRGAHQRTDFPERNDADFLAHSMAYFAGEDAPPRIEYLPVTITRWPAGERIYGK